MIHATKKTLEEAGDKATDEEKEAINTAIAELEEALKGSDKEAIEAKTTALTEASSALAQKMYADAAAAEGSAEDDAVDAEFEEVKDEEKDK